MKLPNFTFFGGSEHKTTFFFFFLNFDIVFYNSTTWLSLDKILDTLYDDIKAYDCFCKESGPECSTELREEIFARPIVPYIGMVAPVQVENVFIIERTCY